MKDCLFCGIAAHNVAAQIVYEDDTLLAFKDIRPKSAVHLLLIPKQHIDNLSTLAPDQTQLMGEMVALLPKLAVEHGLKNGFRTIVNTGAGGGQEVAHLHFHLLGGSDLPPF